MEVISKMRITGKFFGRIYVQLIISHLMPWDKVFVLDFLGFSQEGEIRVFAGGHDCLRAHKTLPS